MNYDGELHKHPQLEADLQAVKELYGPHAVSLRYYPVPLEGHPTFIQTSQTLFDNVEYYINMLGEYRDTLSILP